ncbi:hypothetical protein HPB49_000233 [Dermacentor silvarum]|uniref:Uncharacterized protein n=1 Tax=Dermacentor silvarum TaxID=543639 RepID=A0ACB8CCL4_DERSI|nr:hypothetical protein HPB49_000233 [Dermacentor silvarum]
MHEVMHQFYIKAKFPRVTGCIDCTHVRIKSPGGDDAEVFRNRKGYFSFNVQVTSPDEEHRRKSFRHLEKKIPCLDMKLQIETTTSVIVITACATLHNFGRNHASDELPPDTCNVQQPSPASQAQGPQPVDSASGFRTRARIIQQYFS